LRIVVIEYSNEREGEGTEGSGEESRDGRDIMKV
jgi:hypothetical protein